MEPNRDGYRAGILGLNGSGNKTKLALTRRVLVARSTARQNVPPYVSGKADQQEDDCVGKNVIATNKSGERG